MVKRKFYASLIMLVVASMTLVTGTYAWFLVGGFGSLFDIGFDVIEAGAGLELRGSAGDQTTGWKAELARADFLEGSFLSVDDDNNPVGRYAPISIADASDAANFIKLGLEDGKFIAGGNVTAGVDYNDFKIYARSTSTEAAVNMGMKIAISSDEGDRACDAARVSVTYDGVTTIYALEGQAATNAVTSTFADGAVLDDADPEDRIVTSADTGAASAGLTSQAMVMLKADGTLLTPDADGNTTIFLENVVANAGAGVAQVGSEISVKIWIEGNDADCIDLPENSIAGDSLTVSISFVAL